MACNSPKPSLPWLPSPKANTPSCSVSTSTCWKPAPISRTRFESKTRRMRGTGLDEVSPCPRTPRSPLPHEKTFALRGTREVTSDREDTSKGDSRTVIMNRSVFQIEAAGHHVNRPASASRLLRFNRRRAVRRVAHRHRCKAQTQVLVKYLMLIQHACRDLVILRVPTRAKEANPLAAICRTVPFASEIPRVTMVGTATEV